MTPHQQGYAMFHAGKVPNDMPTTEAQYHALSETKRAIVYGFISARHDMREAYEGKLPPSHRSTNVHTIIGMPKGEAKMTVKRLAREANGQIGVNHSIPKAPRRKGRNAISLRYNGEGVRISWQGQVFMLDSNDAAEHERIINNVINMAAGG